MQMTAKPILKKIGVQSSLINYNFKYSMVIFDFMIFCLDLFQINLSLVKKDTTTNTILPPKYNSYGLRKNASR